LPYKVALPLCQFFPKDWEFKAIILHIHFIYFCYLFYNLFNYVISIFFVEDNFVELIFAYLTPIRKIKLYKF